MPTISSLFAMKGVNNNINIHIKSIINSNFPLKVLGIRSLRVFAGTILSPHQYYK